LIVFCGGSNAVGYNDTQLVLKYITDFVKDSSHNNIILPSVPRLLESSCVNNELDQEINEIRKNFKHTSFGNEGIFEYFTLHGHLNGLGQRFSNFFQVGTTLLVPF
jgi:hypothetical protein